VAVSGGLTFTALTVGDGHVCGLTATGAAYCWGDNSFGELGNGGPYGSRTPVPVAGGLTFAALSAGPGYTCGVTTAGAAYCWGDNTLGRLGNSGGMNSVPVPVAGGLTFTTVSAGADHACGLDATGVAYCWGDNQYHQIGNGSTNPGPFPPTMVTGGHTFTAIDAGGLHTCAISNGAVYCWGDNRSGQLGNGTTGFSGVAALVLGGRTYESISSGALTSCGIASGGAAYCWGENIAGSLGVGTTTGPEQCGGRPCSTTPVAVVGGLTFTQLSIETYSTCGRTSTGVVYCWGVNAWGGLGDGTTTDRSAPVKVLGQP
jgi:alpha-tubulin suppressor-like RCC1 family protein